jgi:hypothetical protein
MKRSWLPSLLTLGVLVSVRAAGRAGREFLQRLAFGGEWEGFTWQLV